MSSDISEDDDGDDKGTDVKDIDSDGGGDKNTNSGESSTEWIRFLCMRSQTEALGDMSKAEASLSTASRKKPKLAKLEMNWYGRERLSRIS